MDKGVWMTSLGDDDDGDGDGDDDDGVGSGYLVLCLARMWLHCWR